MIQRLPFWVRSIHEPELRGGKPGGTALNSSVSIKNCMACQPGENQRGF